MPWNLHLPFLSRKNREKNRSSRASSLGRRSRLSRVEPLEPRALLTATWNGGGGPDTTWGNRDNWANDQLPTVGEDVVIGAGYSQSVGNLEISIGSLTCNSPLVVSNTGAGLTITKDSTIKGDLLLRSGTLTVSGSGTVLDVTGKTTWAYTKVSGNGQTHIHGGLECVGTDMRILTGGHRLNLYAPEQPSGNNVLRDGEIHISDRAAFNIMKDATLEIALPVGEEAFVSTGVPGTVNNYGTIHMDRPGQEVWVRAPLNNAGTVSIVAGTLSLRRDSVHTGTFKISQSGILDFGGGGRQTCTAASAILGQGRVRLRDAATAVIFSGQYDVGQTILNNGLAKFTGRATTGQVTVNAGILHVGASSVLTVSRNMETKTGLEVELAGNPSTGRYGKVVVGNRATLGGILNLVTVNGFRAKVGDSFPVLRYGNRSGQFGRVDVNHVRGVAKAFYANNGVRVQILRRPSKTGIASTDSDSNAKYVAFAPTTDRMTVRGQNNADVIDLALMAVLEC